MVPKFLNQESFKEQSILVIGDVMLDEYWYGNVKRISPEAPVPIINVDQQNYRLGGAANVALNLAKIGVKVTLSGVIGDDQQAKILCKLIHEAGIDFCPLIQQGYQTINKLRIISGNQQIIRVDREQEYADRDLGESFFNEVKSSLAQFKTVIFSDYGKGSLSSAEKIIDCARKSGARILVDPKGSDFDKYRNANAITPNENEFRIIVGDWSNPDEFEEKGASLMQRLGLEALLVTRGDKGMTLFTKDGLDHMPVESNQVFDVTGAGDTVISFLAASLAVGAGYTDSAKLANHAASLSVQKRGAATVSLEELLRKVVPNKEYESIDDKNLLNQLELYRNQEKSIVMTNGCFDILHIGHIKYLESAKKLGDILCIAVNTDESVKDLKGSRRPINNLEDRIALLCSLECVDMVIPFSEATPINIIEAIRPNILVKGGDYQEHNIVGAEFVRSIGGKVKVIEFISGKSTTSLIDRILKLSDS
jgi:D-beta-D-heptose 7-phosphate kinase / D-beta-D-heptose 1-phosphate adenosyltransferase